VVDSLEHATTMKRPCCSWRKEAPIKEARNGKGRFDCDFRICMKCVDISLNQQNRDLIAAINILLQLTTEREGRTRAVYVKPRIRERNMKQSQKKPAKADVHNIGKRP